jgi:ribosomal protein S27AE
MTPKQITAADFSEIGKVEITCNKCGAALVFPVPTEAGDKLLLTNYQCPGCDTKLWGDAHDNRYSCANNLIVALGQWKALKGHGFNLSFSLFQTESVLKLG